MFWSSRHRRCCGDSSRTRSGCWWWSTLPPSSWRRSSAERGRRRLPTLPSRPPSPSQVRAPTSRQGSARARVPERLPRKPQRRRRQLHVVFLRRRRRVVEQRQGRLPAPGGRPRPQPGGSSAAARAGDPRLLRGCRVVAGRPGGGRARGGVPCRPLRGALRPAGARR